jgi:hypothetical protein
MQHINGDKFLTIGTVKEIAEFLNVKEKTVWFYMSPAYLKRVEEWRNKNVYNNSIIIIRIDEE